LRNPGNKPLFSHFGTHYDTSPHQKQEKIFQKDIAQDPGKIHRYLPAIWQGETILCVL
jgi:hypothetical protein